MQQALQTSLIKRIFKHIDAGTTDMSPTVRLNPVDSYVSSSHHKLELERLFGNRSFLLGPSSLLAAPGDYLVDNLSGKSVLLVRTQSGKINGFLNVCRHRGAQLVQGCGRGAKTFVCPYHAWSYDIDGEPRLLSPYGSFPGLAPSDRRLTRVSVAEKDGLIWIGAAADDGSQESVEMNGLEGELDTYRLAGFSHYETRLLCHRMNWKLVIDSFLENWHFCFLHGDTIASMFISGLGLFDAFGDHCRVVYPRQSIRELRGQPEASWDLLKHSAVIYLFFPNSLLLWQQDHVEIWRSFPDPSGDPNASRTEGSLYTPSPANTEKARGHWDRNIS